MEAEKEINKNPYILFQLRSISKRIYAKVGEHKALVCTDTESIPFDERNSQGLEKLKAAMCGAGHLHVHVSTLKKGFL